MLRVFIKVPKYGKHWKNYHGASVFSRSTGQARVSMNPTQEGPSLEPLQLEPTFSIARLACALMAEAPCVQP